MFNLLIKTSGIFILQVFNFFNNFFKIKNIKKVYLICKSDVWLRETTKIHSDVIGMLYLVPIYCLYLHKTPAFGFLVMIVYLLKVTNRLDLLTPLMLSGLVLFFLNKNIVVSVIGLEVLSSIISILLVVGLSTSSNFNERNKSVNVFLINSLALGILLFCIIFFYIKIGYYSEINLFFFKNFLLVFFVLKFGNILFYSTKSALYETLRFDYLIVITAIQLVLVPIILVNNMPYLPISHTTYIPFFVLLLNLMGLSQLFGIKNIKYLLLYTTTLTNVMGVLYLTI